MGCCRSKPKLNRAHNRATPVDDSCEESFLASNEDESVTRKVKDVLKETLNHVTHQTKFAVRTAADMTRLKKSRAQFEAPEMEVKEFLEEISTKKSFTEHRWDCIWRPDRAVHTLGPYANLSLEIQRGKKVLTELTERTRGEFLHETVAGGNLFVRVFVDDTQMWDSDPVRKSKEPEWNANCNIGIVAARSMIRLQIFDRAPTAMNQQDELDPQITGTAPTPTRSLGFVEFCAGDIPFGEDIECWLELRFPDLLQGNNMLRYRQHCQTSDEERNRMLDEAHEQQASIGLFGTARVRHARRRGAIAHVRGKVRGLLSMSGDSSCTSDFQFNAGLLRVKMILTRTTDSWFDQYFALALEAPCAEFELLVQQEHMPELDLQSLVDDTLDVKLALLDDFLFAFFLWVWYILIWKSWVISFVCTSVAMCYFTGYPDEEWFYIGLFIMWMLLLGVNYFEEQRLNMTTGGINAPLTEEGFKRVAHWDDYWQMHVFMLRIVGALGGTVRSEHDLHQFVVLMVKDGKPVAKLHTVLEALRQQKWCRLKPPSLKVNDMVRLHGRRKALVKKVEMGKRKKKNSMGKKKSGESEASGEESSAESGGDAEDNPEGGDDRISRIKLEFDSDEDEEPTCCSSWTPFIGDEVYSKTDRSFGDWRMDRERIVDGSMSGKLVWVCSVSKIGDNKDFKLVNRAGRESPHFMKRVGFFFFERNGCMLVSAENVEARLVVPPVSRHWVSTVDTFGVGLKTLIAAWSFRISKIKEWLLPLLRTISEVLTWQRWHVTLMLMAYFLARLFLGICHKFFPEERPLVRMVEEVVRFIVDNVPTVIFLLAIFQFAALLGWLRAIARIFAQYGWTRSAPAAWAFSYTDEADAVRGSQPRLT